MKFAAPHGIPWRFCPPFSPPVAGLKILPVVTSSAPAEQLVPADALENSPEIDAQLAQLADDNPWYKNQRETRPNPTKRIPELLETMGPKHIFMYIYIYVYIYICIYIVPIAIQWVGRAPWFCKYNLGAWPPCGVPSITKSMGHDPPKAWFSLQNQGPTSTFKTQLTPQIHQTSSKQLTILKFGTKMHPLIL